MFFMLLSDTSNNHTTLVVLVAIFGTIQVLLGMLFRSFFLVIGKIVVTLVGKI